MERQPNFHIIMSDQHSPHIMGCAGDPIIRTPNLDLPESVVQARGLIREGKNKC